MSCITHPNPLVERAISEMQCPTYLIGGLPSYGEIVDKMAELWQAYFARGDIKYSPPAAASKAGGNRVDAMQLELEGDDGDDEPLLYAVTPGGQRTLICWTCCGFDHTKERCPSKRRTSINDALRMLEDAKIHDPSFGSQAPKVPPRDVGVVPAADSLPGAAKGKGAVVVVATPSQLSATRMETCTIPSRVSSLGALQNTLRPSLTPDRPKPTPTGADATATSWRASHRLRALGRRTTQIQ